MNEFNPIRCQFTLSDAGSETSLHVGTKLNLTLEIPAEYPGASVGTLRCEGRIVAIEPAKVPGRVSVVCEIEDMDSDPDSDFWQKLAS